MVTCYRVLRGHHLMASRLAMCNEINQRTLCLMATNNQTSRHFTLTSPRKFCHQPVKLYVPRDISTIHKSFLRTSAVFLKSLDLFDATATTKATNTKDKAALAKEKSALRKYQDDGSPQIMLIESEGKYIQVSLKKAERIAKRRDLKIVQVEDPSVAGKIKKPVYKLVTGKEYFEINMAQKAAISSSAMKGEKVLSVKGTIADKDLQGKLSSVEKWVKKGHQIKATIVSRGASKEHMESVFGKIEEGVAAIPGRILQRREKFGDIKFYIAPPKQEKKKEKNQAEQKLVPSENLQKEE